jgi:hypothetical protein
MANPLAQAIRDGAELPRCKIHDRQCVGAKDLLDFFKTNQPRSVSY